MDMQAALRARLRADAGVKAIVSTRVDWVDRPQLSALPAIVLQTISDSNDQTMKDFQALQQTRVQVDVFAKTYAEARAASKAIIAAAVPAGDQANIRFYRASVEGPRDLTETVTNQTVHRSSLDLVLWWKDRA